MVVVVEVDGLLSGGPKLGLILSKLRHDIYKYNHESYIVPIPNHRRRRRLLLLLLLRLLLQITQQLTPDNNNTPDPT